MSGSDPAASPADMLEMAPPGSTSEHWLRRIVLLDSQAAEDREYRLIFSTISKELRKKGESWRARALRIAAWRLGVDLELERDRAQAEDPDERDRYLWDLE